MNEPQYFVDDAAQVVHRNISLALQQRLSLKDIVVILDTEFEFLQQCNIASSDASIVNIPIEVPARLDEAAMEYFIINRCARQNIYLSYEEVQEVLEAELFYLEQLGLIDHDTPKAYQN